MRPKNIFFITLIVMIFSMFKNVLANDSELTICWPGQNCFKEKSDKFLISAEDAHKNLYSKTREHAESFFFKQPIFIIGDEYFFSEPEKISAPLKGFFVNGNTGKIEYRKSDIKIKAKQKNFPKDAFISIETIE